MDIQTVEKKAPYTLHLASIKLYIPAVVSASGTLTSRTQLLWATEREGKKKLEMFWTRWLRK
jgi:hypothetical protein